MAAAEHQQKQKYGSRRAPTETEIWQPQSTNRNRNMAAAEHQQKQKYGSRRAPTETEIWQPQSTNRNRIWQPQSASSF